MGWESDSSSREIPSFATKPKKERKPKMRFWLDIKESIT
jgi:hypothetical protein